MFIDDFDLKIHLYGDENNFGLLTIDDGRLNGDKEHDEKIYNKLPQASFSINHVTSEKIGKAIANYVESYLVYVEESDYNELLSDYTIYYINAIEYQLNSFIHSIFFNTDYSKSEKINKKYVSVTFIRKFSFEYFFLTFNPLFKHSELLKIINEFTKLIYGNKSNNLLYAVQDAIIKDIRGTNVIEELEERSFVDHSDVLKELKQLGVFDFMNLDCLPNEIQFRSFTKYFVLHDFFKKALCFNSIYYTSPQFMSMVLSKLNPEETKPMSIEEIVKKESIGCYFMDVRKKGNDYEFRYGLKKKN